MPNYSNQNQFNATSNDRHSLALKLFAGETLALYDKATYMLDMTQVKRPLNGGRVVSFPTFGDANAKYVTLGDNLITSSGYLNQIKVGEKLIWADKILQSSILLDTLDQALASWDARSAFSHKMTQSMKYVTEEALFKLVARAAKVGHSTMEGRHFTGQPLGGYSYDSGFAGTTTGTALIDFIFDAQAAWDGNNVPSEGRYAFVRPADYLLIQRTLNSSSKAYQPYGYTNGATIGRLPGDGIWIGNVYVMKSSLLASLHTASQLDPAGSAVISTSNNRLGGSAQYLHDELTVDPATSSGVDAETPIGNRYNFTFSSVSVTAPSGNDGAVSGWTGGDALGKPYCIMWQQEAIGTCQALAPTVEASWMPEYLAWLVTVHQAMGHGVLRPECTAFLYD